MKIPKQKVRGVYARAGVDASLAAGLIAPFIRRFPPSCHLLPKNYFCQLIPIPRPYGSPKSFLALSTDGVGTKVLLGTQTGICDGLGQDLVGMIYNDLITSGSRPAAFLDYYATGRLAPPIYRRVISSIQSACTACDMPLVGGETAEMPGLYGPGHFDLAGFGVGWAKSGDILSPSRVRPGFILIGFPSSGFHSNGYSLVRKVIADRKVRLAEKITLAGNRRPIREFLMAPTILYTELARAVQEHKISIAAMAHITGGGYFENVPRSLPENCAAVFEKKAFTTESTEIFRWFASVARMSQEEMMHVFNCGFGMVAIAAPHAWPAVRRRFPEAVRVGWVEKSTGRARVCLAA